MVVIKGFEFSVRELAGSLVDFMRASLLLK
jgi:hypothetical protein